MPTPIAVAHLRPGDLAPDFTLTAADGSTQVSLSGYRGRKVIVYFYPAASTPGCTTQACDFGESLADFERAGYAIIGISPDPPAKLATFRDELNTGFPLLSDPDHTVLTSWGAYGEKQIYGKTIVGVLRSTFVVDEEGRLEQALYNVRATGHVAKLRRDLGI